MNRRQSTSPDMTFRDVTLAMFRHRKKAAAVFLTVMTATVLITLATPKSYLSEAELFVRLGRENAMLDSAATLGENSVVAVPMSRDNEINSIAEMLSNRAILETVTDELGPPVILEGLPSISTVEGEAEGVAYWLEQAGKQVRQWCFGTLDAIRGLVSTSDLTDREMAIEHLEKGIEVEPVRNTNVVLVSYEAKQPELAQKVVTSVVDTYLEQHVRFNRTQGSHDFFAEHTERLDKEVKRLEGELRELKTTTGLASVEQQRSQIVSRIGRLEDDLLAVESARSEAAARIAGLRKQLEGLPKEQVTETATGIGNNGTDMIREQFFALQVKEKEAAAKYTPLHPRLTAIREELAEAERILATQEQTRTQITTAPDVTYEQVRSVLVAEEPNLTALEAKRHLLASQLDDVRESLAALNANETRIGQLQREIELCEADYRKYAMNLEQTRIDEAMERQRMSNISVVQPASMKPRPVRPRKALNMAIGLIAALFAAFGVALSCEYSRPSEKSDEVDKQNGTTQVLNSIPRVRSEAAMRVKVEK